MNVIEVAALVKAFGTTRALDGLDLEVSAGTAYVFENTGVGAYLSAAPSLFDQKELLAAAAGIFGVEAGTLP